MWNTIYLTYEAAATDHITTEKWKKNNNFIDIDIRIDSA